MDWPSLVVGAFVGGGVGLVMQNILFPVIDRGWKARKRRAFYVRSLKIWERVEKLHPRLVLVQAGWDRDGAFPEGSVVLRLGSPFSAGRATDDLQRAHADEWVTAGFANLEQIGIAAISNTRISDDPAAELTGQAHMLTITAHSYRFFDYLATHLLRLRGTDSERALLNALAGSPGPDQPVVGFPTPCSVGLSVLCEGGTRLVLTRRSGNSGAGGYWEAGKIFNAVGETAALRDFAAASRHVGESTPQTVARRGLQEELGFRDTDIGDSVLRLHSFAWASDLLDFKFFGSLETALTRSEVQDRWRNAPDRSESSGEELITVPVQTARDCEELLVAIRDRSADWSPEAVFSTMRTLVTLRRISPDDILRIIGSQARRRRRVA